MDNATTTTATAAQQINEVIDHAAGVLGSGIEATQPLAEIVVREFALRNIVQGCGYSVAALVISAIVFTAYWIAVKYAWKAKDDELKLAVTIVGGTITAIALIPSAILVSDAIDAFARAVSPHYSIIEQLLKSV